MTHALVFANGDIADGPMVRQALAAAEVPFVVAADGGARVAQHFGLHVDLVIGDMDSLTSEELDALVAAGAETEVYSPEKDFTDLELALKRVRERDCCWIRIIGGLGNRLDQTLGNIYLLALPELQGCDVKIVAGKQATRLLYPGEHVIQGHQGDTISLIPLGGAVHGVRTHNLYYPLEDETLDFGPARGISNVMDAEQATITIGQGKLLLVHTMGRA